MNVAEPTSFNFVSYPNPFNCTVYEGLPFAVQIEKCKALKDEANSMHLAYCMYGFQCFKDARNKFIDMFKEEMNRINNAVQSINSEQ